ncbi:Enolase-phosphatase E1 [Tyrophagus putrescentiae]|nr:Enolase-phosphatase E1 [Tyrophagus putrescentiae]
MTEEPSTQSPKPTTSFKLPPLQSSSPPSPLPLPQPLPIITTTTTIPLKQPHHILFDIWGVITSHTFRADLYQYLEREDVLESFLQASFHTPEVERFLQAFVLKNISDRGEKGYHQLPIIGLADCCDDKRSKVASLAKNLRLRLQLRKQDPSLVDGNIEALFNLVWMEGYKSKRLRTHAFPDVLVAFRKWTASNSSSTNLRPLQLHSFASGPPENQRLFLAASAAGDLATNFITSFFDASSLVSGVSTSKKSSALYREVLAKLGIKPEDSGLSAVPDRFAEQGPGGPRSAAGLTVVIVRRPGNRLYKAKDLLDFIVIDSLEQLAFTATAVDGVDQF